MQNIIDLFERLVVAQERLADAANNKGAADVGKPVTATPAKATKAMKDTSKPADVSETPVVVEETPKVIVEVKVAEVAAPVVEVKAQAPEADFPYDKLKKAVVDLANTGKAGKNAALSILAKYNVKKASDADPKLWEQMYYDAVEALGELGG